MFWRKYFYQENLLHCKTSHCNSHIVLPLSQQSKYDYIALVFHLFGQPICEVSLKFSQQDSYVLFGKASVEW